MDAETKRNLKKMDMPLYGAFGCVLIAFILNLLSFASPYWLESYPDTNSAFLRMGIWEVCFDGYLHPQDSKANVWRGCFWIFDRRFLDTKLWYYLDPPWMIACQVLCVIAFLLHIVAALTMILYFLYYGQPFAESAAAWICELGSGILMFIVICIFGRFSEDRQWMPRPDHNHLSWAYAYAVLGAMVSFGACIFLTCLSRNDKALQREVEYMEQFGAYKGDGFDTAPRDTYHRGTRQPHGTADLSYPAPYRSERSYAPQPPASDVHSVGHASVASSRHVQDTYKLGGSTVHVPRSTIGSQGVGSSFA